MSDGHGGGGKRRGGHEEEHEEHENHERWLVSYADMMTLLMVLFIVMFAISQVDNKKFMALKTGLAAGFGAPVSFVTGADSMLAAGGQIDPSVPNVAGMGGGKKDGDQQGSPNAEKLSEEALKEIAELVNATTQAQVAQEVENLKAAQEQVKKALKEAGLESAASFRFDERGLVISIATDSVLFPSGSAALQERGQEILDAVAPTLRSLPNRISIDGHTNRAPINTAQFPSNWELSTARATQVLRYLLAAHNFAGEQLTAAGFADTVPLLPYADPNAMAANRRVEIVIMARRDDAAGRAISELGNKNDADDAAEETPDEGTSGTDAGTEPDPEAVATPGTGQGANGDATPTPTPTQSAPPVSTPTPKPTPTGGGLRTEMPTLGN